MKRIDRSLHADAVQAHRREDCLHYQSCLSEASARLWPSFSCKGCELYHPESKSSSRPFDHASSPQGWDI